MSEPIQIWAGVECTRNRVGDRYFDQLKATGHDRRAGDLHLIAELGAKVVRYPVLWEHVEQNGAANWPWADERLAALRELKLRPIVGLIHHGSGPADTDLLDPEFPERLARFARKVAERYPWVKDFTPVNEPNTTARFAGLYGHWYPHGRSDTSYLRALVNQCRASTLCMQAIRSVIPDARLVQTEDMGQTSSTERLRYQAEFENERRWLSFDVLCGRVNREHPLWRYCLDRGQVSESELAWFAENPCPPEIVGLNYYLSSERFLHDDPEKFPEGSRGGNGRDRYADLETARVREESLIGPEKILLQTWERYGIPLAITECHNGCTREEQLRWVLKVWRGCQAARAKGADVRALTAWSVFGATDWDSLVTLPRNHYEPGVYDVRSPQPRATALAGLFRTLAQGEEFRHPLAEAPGWWERPERFVYGVRAVEESNVVPIRRNARAAVTPLVITVGEGPLVQRLLHDCNVRGIPWKAFDDAELSISERMCRFVRGLRPWAIVDGRTVMDAEHLRSVQILARFCFANSIRLMKFFGDAVFPGDKQTPHVESDPLFPQTQAAHMQAEGERELLAYAPSALVIRSGPLFAPHSDDDFLSAGIQKLAAGQRVEAAIDLHSPTYLPDLSHCALDLLIDGESGIWHLANAGAISEFELLTRAAEEVGISAATLVRLPGEEQRNFAMASERAWIMPSLDSAVQRYCEKIKSSFLLEEAA